jgi:hypothetical protein
MGFHGPMGAAIINNTAKLFRVIARVLRGAPNTRSAKLAAPALLVVIGTVHLPPCMGPAFHNAPTFAQGIFDSGGYFLFRVGHRDNREVALVMLDRGVMVVK